MEARERRYRLPRPIAAFVEAAQESPALLPCLAAVVTFLLLAAADAGYYPTAWYPAALFVLALLVVTTITVGFPRRLPWPALTALVLFAAYTAWTYLSITWAGQQGDAWEGANRTALYLLVFALFALWPMSETGGRIVLGLFGLGVAGIGLVEALRVDAAANPAAFFVDARFLEPAGYINSNVALWMLGALACLFSAAARESLVAAACAVPGRSRAAGRAGADGPEPWLGAGAARGARAVRAGHARPGPAAGGYRVRGCGRLPRARAARGRARRRRDRDAGRPRRRGGRGSPAPRGGARADRADLGARRPAGRAVGGRGARSPLGPGPRYGTGGGGAAGGRRGRRPGGPAQDQLERLQGGRRGAGEPDPASAAPAPTVTTSGGRRGSCSRRSPCAASGWRTSRSST